jgi:hypothetical protein
VAEAMLVNLVLVMPPTMEEQIAVVVEAVHTTRTYIEAVMAVPALL